MTSITFDGNSITLPSKVDAKELVNKVQHRSVTGKLHTDNFTFTAGRLLQVELKWDYLEATDFAILYARNNTDSVIVYTGNPVLNSTFHIELDWDYFGGSTFKDVKAKLIPVG